MRSTDRTMLAQLGFADRDKGNQDHYLACRYLSGPAANKVIEWCCKKHPSPASRERPDHPIGVYPDDLYKKKIRVGSMEVAISKGDGQYRSTVGFLDVHLHFVERLTPCGNAGCCGHSVYHQPEWVKGGTYTVGYDEPVTWTMETRVNALVTYRDVFIEVKIGRVGVDDVMRQIALYREYVSSPCSRWAMASPWLPSVDERLVLSEHGIDHIALGVRFDAWKKTVTSSDADASGFEA